MKLAIPPRFENATLDSFLVSSDQQRGVLALVRAYVDKWESRKAVGAGLIFSGRPGTGKTHLAYAHCREIEARYQQSVCITTASRMTRLIRSARRRDGDLSEVEVFSFYTAFDYLLIDEVGIGMANDIDRAILFDVVNSRYMDNLPTSIITNLTPQECPIAIGEQTYDRLICQTCTLVFPWDSYRRQPTR